MKKVSIYSRSATQTPQAINAQLRACREYAARQGWEVVGTYSDDGLSGFTLDRPGMKTLLEDLRAGKFDVLLAECIDRLSRNQADAAALYKMTRAAGAKLVTLIEGEITDHNAFVLSLRQCFDSFMRSERSQRMRRTRRILKEQGIPWRRALR
jgi:site-specific DNA recombinase